MMHSDIFGSIVVIYWMILNENIHNHVLMIVGIHENIVLMYPHLATSDSTLPMVPD